MYRTESHLLYHKKDNTGERDWVACSYGQIFPAILICDVCLPSWQVCSIKHTASCSLQSGQLYHITFTPPQTVEAVPLKVHLCFPR
jgi:hypothetical protein